MAQALDTRVAATIRRVAEGLDGLDQEAVEAFLSTHRAMKRFRAAFHEQFAQEQLSPPRFGVLVALLDCEEVGLTPAELADEIAVSRASMTGFLDGLEQMALVSRERHPSDRRMTMVCITPKGRALLESVLPTHVRLMAEIFAGLTHAEMRQLQGLMWKVARGPATEGEE